MDKNDRFLLIVIFIIMAIFVFSYMFSILDNRQIAIQKDIAGIKQTVERIELNTAVLDTIVIPLPDSMPWYHIEFKLIHKEVNNGNKDNN